jgi:copper resistance protein C
METFARLLLDRAEGDRVGLPFEDERHTWAEVVRADEIRAEPALAFAHVWREKSRPPHVGALLENVPEYVFWIGACSRAPDHLAGYRIQRGADRWRSGVHKVEASTLPSPGSTHMRSTLRVRAQRLGLVTAITVAFGAGFAAPASAHTTLLESTPAKGATVRELAEVRLLFSEKLQPALVKVQVRDAAGGRHETAEAPRVTGATVRQSVTPGLPGGAYKIVYRVVSNDGHPVTGEVQFTLIGPARGGAAPAAGGPAASPGAEAPAAVPAATAGSEGTKRWLMLGGGLLFGILIGLGFVVLRRPRQEPSSGD